MSEFHSALSRLESLHRDYAAILRGTQRLEDELRRERQLVEHWKQRYEIAAKSKITPGQKEAALHATASLREARSGLQQLPEDVLGTGTVEETGEHYSLRDEVIYNLSRSIEKLQKEVLNQ